MSLVLDLHEPAGVDGSVNTVDAVGGKAANLAILLGAGFPVPPGFAVTTDSYTAFADASGLTKLVEAAATEFDYANVDRLEAQTAEIRAHVEASPLPNGLEEQILERYRALGGDRGDRYVAVRSSGTAEDTAGASFAGLHDTYLDVRGGDEVLTAVRRCWASMWTARATAYRHQYGFDHTAARIAVVVQLMVEARVSGVMFTANPLTAATDEIVINASWGLGEGIVSGIATPDEYRVARGGDGRIRAATIGPKEVEVVRDPTTGVGTIVRPVPADRQAARSLDDDQVTALAQLGERVMAHYDDLPQDTEWALAGGQFYLLQARPITGADFIWTEDLEEWQVVPEAPDTTWTVKWANEFWTGAITPMFYSVRGREFQALMQRFNTLCGFDELNGLRYFKYYRGTAYYNAEVDRTFFNNVLPRAMRAGSLGYLPQAWVPEVLEQPLNLARFVKALARMQLTAPHKAPQTWHRTVRGIIGRTEEADGPSVETLRGWSDAQVRAQLDTSIELAEQFMDELWSGLWFATQWAMGLLGQMLAKWYDGGNAFVFPDLISGLGRPTLMSTETHDLWKLADRIRSSEPLLDAFRAHEGAAFFSALADVPGGSDGAEFLTEYRRFIVDHGHRGHADRDIWFARRVEDPSLDYQSIRALLSTDDPTPPWVAEEKVAQRRRDTEDEVLASIRRTPFGGLKAEAFKMIYAHVLDFLVLRDDWRHYVDRISLAKKRCLLELADRAVDRGLLVRREDAFFLGEREFLGLLDGGRRTPLMDAKIAGRRKVFDDFLSHRASPPTYLLGDTPAELDAVAADDGDGSVLHGTGTARGSATGPARVVPELARIGEVRQGDILVCNGTDPGWAPVFPLISGLIIETGGMLAHGSCLSREYGIPAVQLRGAMQLIEAGATITVDGATGEIRIESGEPAAGEPSVAEPQPAAG